MKYILIAVLFLSSCSQDKADYPKEITVEVTKKDHVAGKHYGQPVLEAFSRTVKTKNVGFKHNGYLRPEVEIFDEDSSTVAVYILPENYSDDAVGKFTLHRINP